MTDGKQILDERDGSLVSEQLQAVCANQLFAVPMNCLLALSITVIVRSDVKLGVLVCWFVANLVLNAGRVVLAHRSKRSSGSRRARGLLRLNGLLMLLTGCLWAFVPGLMFDITNSRAPYVMFVLAGISAGATVHSST